MVEKKEGEKGQRRSLTKLELRMHACTQHTHTHTHTHTNPHHLTHQHTFLQCKHYKPSMFSTCGT